MSDDPAGEQQHRGTHTLRDNVSDVSQTHQWQNVDSPQSATLLMAVVQASGTILCKHHSSTCHHQLTAADENSLRTLCNREAPLYLEEEIW
jgi:hypothetical protein